MAHELTEAQLRKEVMEFLIKKGRWGAHYYPLDTLVNFLAKRVKRNGTRVARTVKELAREGYLLFHKKGDTVSLNSARSKEIMEYVTA